ncbi:BclA C-terminal domain-containing protein, partial [Desulfosporosinus metallidurans]|uniref:BclA C-terminal domain-containing protein n=1 Tax=Desulfosporosinus metallidurans TaxID=1888891 RepID=UPI000AF9F25C
GPTGSGLASFGYVYDLAILANATIAGGSDVPFSDNGPLTNITHVAGSTTITVVTTGIYEIFYSVSFTAGLNASFALTVNGTVDASTPVPALVSVGEIAGQAILSLVAGDLITLRNNSLISAVLALSPSVGAQFTIIRLN